MIVDILFLIGLVALFVLSAYFTVKYKNCEIERYFLRFSIVLIVFILFFSANLLLTLISFYL